MSSPISIVTTPSRPSKADYNGSDDNLVLSPGGSGLYPASVARLSPTLTRTFDPNDPSNLERQRTMDADVAIQLSRARSASLAAARRPSNASPPAPEQVSTYVVNVEEEDGSDAYNIHTEDQEHAQEVRRRLVDEPERIMDRTHDPVLLVSSPERATPHLQTLHSEMTRPPPPEYLPSTAYRNGFDFGPLEEFGRAEKERLNIASPVDIKPQSSEQDLRRRLVQVDQEQQEGPTQTAALPLPLQATEISGETPTSTRTRSRQRKLSYSHPQPRRGKLAMFESSLAASSTLHSQLPLTSSFDDGQRPHPPQQPPLHIALSMGMGPDDAHQDKPFRFSFYSNALPSTIHARSLAELPAEGQTFEQLFQGRREREHAKPPASLSSLGGLGAATSTSVNLHMGSGYATTAARSVHRLGGDHSSEPPPPGPPPKAAALFEDDDANTWWLDVLSPTDEEMRVLSKVFGIHPLTTEDILMEETREKIELFQNYYLVSFRSFDQNPYSPTHLEPINYYIVVFREGTLSFHFRPSPHPQNVRRRIKQLKDYISVTSDWISYALIDDITDAFGPLIEGIEYEVDSIDELVLILKDSEQSDMLRRIGTCRKKVMGLLRLMGNKADVVKGLAKRCNENWSMAPKSDIGLYLSDIQDHLITMTQSLNHYEKLLSRSHSNYLAQISIEMTDVNNRINNVLSRMTALGTVLIPMNVITGLWGMNVHVPGQDDHDTYHWFTGIVCILLSFGLIGGLAAYWLMQASRQR